MSYQLQKCMYWEEEPYFVGSKVWRYHQRWQKAAEISDGTCWGPTQRPCGRSTSDSKHSDRTNRTGRYWMMAMSNSEYYRRDRRCNNSCRCDTSPGRALARYEAWMCTTVPHPGTLIWNLFIPITVFNQTEFIRKKNKNYLQLFWANFYF